MKKLFAMMLALCLMVTAIPVAFATETESPTEVVRAADECGENLTWSFEHGVLTISGSGAMDDYTGDAPWAVHRKDIAAVVFSGNVTYIGARAFKNYDSLETVDFGDAMYEIGTEAFQSCDALVSIELPDSFKIFGEGSFMSCKGLKEIHCAGRFPSFRENCLWDTYVTIYYPAEKPWNVETVGQLEEAFHGRVQFLASDGTDHYTPTEEATEAATEPVITEPETEPVVATEPPMTEPPVTEAPTEPVVTEAPTEAVQAPEETAAPTEPAEPASGLDGISIGLIIVGVVLGLLVLGALIFSGKFRGKGRYSR